MNQLNRSKVTEGLHFSAKKIKDIGDTVLINGKTIEEYFAYNGVSFWKCAQPDMALHILPPILFKNDVNNFYQSKAKLYLKSIKYQIKEILSTIRGQYFFNNSRSNNYVWFLLASTEYIYRDTLSVLNSQLNSNSIIVDNYVSLFNKSNKVRIFSCDWVKRLKLFFKIKGEFRRKRKYFYDNELDHLCSLHPEIPKRGMYLLIFWLTNVFVKRNIINLINTENCFQYNLPQVVVSGDVADPLNRFYSEVAKKRDILVVDIQFGVYDETSVEWKFCLADKVIVWGKYFYNLFHDVHNIEKSKLEILGSPRFDYLLKRSDTIKVYSSNNIKILFASMYTAISDYDASYDVSLIRKFKEMVISVCKEYENLVELIIKPHPLEDISWIKDISNDKFCKILEKKEDIRNHLEDIDVFLTFGSTSTFDALLSNKIVLSANTQGLVWWDDLFIKEGVSISIESESTLRNFILDFCSTNRERILEDNKIKINRFLENKVLHTDESSSVRIIRLISSFI